MPGGWPAHPELSNPASLGVNYAASHGTTVTTSATANTKGAWTQLTASTTGGAGFIVVQAAALGSSAMTSAAIDIGVGPAGAEAVIASNLLVMGPAGGVYMPTIAYFQLPIEIRATSRISARAQCNIASAVPIYVSVQAFDQGFPGNPQIVDTYGFNAATTFGTAIDAGSTINTKGSWVALSASTTYDLTGFMLAFDLQGDITSGQGNVQYLIDVGVGAAASEQIIVADLSLFSLRNALPGGTSWNPADASGMSLSNSNLTAATNTTAQAGIRAMAPRSTGKLYFEVTAAAGGGGASGVSGSQTVGTNPAITGPTAGTVSEGGTLAITGVSAEDPGVWPAPGQIAINVRCTFGSVSLSIAGAAGGGSTGGSGTTYAWANVSDADRASVLGSIVYTAGSSAGSDTVNIEIWDTHGNNSSIDIAITITGSTGISAAYSFGIANATWTLTDPNGLGGDNNSLGYDSGDTIWLNNVPTTPHHDPVSAGDTVGVAIDLDAAKIHMRVNGGAFNGDPVAGTGGFDFSTMAAGPYYVTYGNVGQVGDAGTVNAGSVAFRDPPPTGFSAWGGGGGAAWNSLGPQTSTFYAVPIKAGSRIAMRSQCSSNEAIARVVGATLYGVRA